jgi:hypothetical protein
MSIRDAFDRGMDALTLDANTAERLVTGAVGVDDAPPRYRSVVRVLDELRADPGGSELGGAPAAVDAIASAVVLGPRGRAARHTRRRRSRAGLLAAVSVVSCVLLTGGLAAAGALPAPAQRVASAALDRIGISVPSGHESHADRETPATTPAPALAQPVAQPGTADSSSGQPPSATDPSPRASASEPATEPASPPATPAAETSPVSGNGNGNVHTPPEPPPGNGNGNAYGLGNGNAQGNGNDNAYDLGNANAQGNGNGNAYGLGSGNGPADR